MSDPDLPKLMKALEASFKPEKAAGFSGIFQCHIRGVNEGDWKMEVADGEIQIQPGIQPAPRATLELSKEDLLGLLDGSLDPVKAFFSGKVQLRGDMAAVMKLIGFFEIKTDQFK